LKAKNFKFNNKHWCGPDSIMFYNLLLYLFTMDINEYELFKRYFIKMFQLLSIF